MLYKQGILAELELPADKRTQAEEIAQEVYDQWETETQRPWEEVSGKVELIRIETYRNVITPSLIPVSVVTQIRERSAPGADWTTLVADTDYVVFGNQIERFGAQWASFVEITYTGGYVDSTLPGDIKRALRIQARFVAEHINKNLTTSNQAFEGGSTSYLKQTYHPLFASTAKKYRRLHV